MIKEPPQGLPEIDLIKHPVTGDIVPEVWVNAFGCNGKHIVSNYARVYSFKFNRLLRPNKAGGTPTRWGDYRYVTVNSKHWRLNRLVFISFHGDHPDRSLVIDHKDNDVSNNHLLNLQRITHRENTSKDKTSKSRFPGIYQVYGKYWVARTWFNGKMKVFGQRKSEEEAARLYVEGMKNLGLQPITRNPQ